MASKPVSRDDGVEELEISHPVYGLPILLLRTADFRLSFLDFFIGGLHNFCVVSCGYDFTTHKHYLKVTVPKVTCRAFFKASGKIMGMAVERRGHCAITFVGGEYVFTYDARLLKRNRNIFVISDYHCEFEFTLEKVHFNVEDFTKANIALNTEMNKFLNRNWRKVIHVLKDEITETVKLFAHILIKNALD